MSNLDFAKEVQNQEIVRDAQKRGIGVTKQVEMVDTDETTFGNVAKRAVPGLIGGGVGLIGGPAGVAAGSMYAQKQFGSTEGSDATGRTVNRSAKELKKEIMQQERQKVAGKVQNTAEEKVLAKHAAQAANSEAAPTATPAQKDVARETARQQTVESKKLPANDPRRRGQTATDMWPALATAPENLPSVPQVEQALVDAAEGEAGPVSPPPTPAAPVPPDRAAAHEEWQKGQQDLVNKTARAQTAGGTTIMERMRRQGLQAGNVSTSMGTRDTQERFSGALEMQRAGGRAGVGMGVFGGGGARGATGRRGTKRQTRQERIAANIAKGEEKLKKLEKSGAGPGGASGSVWGNDAWRKQQEKLANMRGLIDDPTQAAMQGKAGDPTQLPPEARKAQQKKPAAAAGSAEQLAQTGETLAEKMHETFVTGGDYVANRITEALKTIPEEIRLNATLGPVTVNLAGGQVLEELKNGILSEMRGAIQSAIQARFNADGSVKDASTQSVVPRDPGGRPMGHHRGEVEL